MKAEDLMAGDWVKTVCRKRESYQRVRDINSSDYPYIITAGSEEKWFLVEVEPIPLTAEILEKNGFEKHDFKFIWTLITKEYRVEIEWKGKTMLEIGHNFTIKDEQGRYDNANYIRGWQENIYVHELQHALKLCGINLEIKL